METRRRRRLLTAFAVLAAVAVVVGAALFQPWRLFTSSTLDEPLPAAATAPASPAVSGTPAAPHPSLPAPLPHELGRGSFQSQEHPTSGTALLLQLPDGSRVLRLEDMASSDGPDIKIWLSDLDAGGDWFKYRSGRYLDLGTIKATHGNQNYQIPPEVDLTGFRTVVLWCDRFSVAFGSAGLT
ncbi:DM13 domain-containing protein [Arthrobacter sp. RHLT1-20]